MILPIVIFVLVGFALVACFAYGRWAVRTVRVRARRRKVVQLARLASYTTPWETFRG